MTTYIILNKNTNARLRNRTEECRKNEISSPYTFPYQLVIGIPWHKVRNVVSPVNLRHLWEWDTDINHETSDVT